MVPPMTHTFKQLVYILAHLSLHYKTLLFPSETILNRKSVFQPIHLRHFSTRIYTVLPLFLKKAIYYFSLWPHQN